MLIGFSGKMGVGKTTVAHMLLELARYNSFSCFCLSFGDAVKEEVARIYNFPLDWAYNNKDAIVSIDTGVTPVAYIKADWQGKATVRQIMQHYATDIVRKKDANYWLKAFDNKLNCLPADHAFVLVDDVRFPNELEYVRRRGVCYRIHTYPGYKFPVQEHESEIALDYAKFDGHFRPEFGLLGEVACRIVNIIKVLSLQ